ncbi:zinc-ribbon domain-containing protein [Acidobacteriota bacterium]
MPLFTVKKGTPFWFCENCNKNVDDLLSGTEIRQEYGMLRCLSCGRTMEQDFAFCPYCGKAI